MKILLEVEDSEVTEIKAMIDRLKGVKTTLLSPERELLYCELQEAADNLQLVKEGKLEGRPARELLDELYG